MRPIKLIGLSLFLAILLNSSSSFSQYCLEFQAIKERFWGGPLKGSFLQKMAELFKADIFVETGTEYGATLNNAKHYFEDLYSIEINKSFYQKALEKFKNNNNIHLLYGNSSEVLPEILSRMDKQALFWLDAHDSFTSNPIYHPILREIKNIGQYYNSQPIILVDDIILFKTNKNYPSIKQLKETMLSVNSNYEFVLLFDAALAFPKQTPVNVSPILKACTLSYLFENGSEKEEQEVIEAEKIIASCTGREKKFILDLLSIPKTYEKIGAYHLWAGLIFLHDQEYEKAKKCFTEAIKRGCNHWRAQEYLKLCGT